MKTATNLDILFYDEEVLLHFILSHYLHNAPLGIVCCVVAKLRCFFVPFLVNSFNFLSPHPFLIMTELVTKVYLGGGWWEVDGIDHSQVSRL